MLKNKLIYLFSILTLLPTGLVNSCYKNNETNTFLSKNSQNKTMLKHDGSGNTLLSNHSYNELLDKLDDKHVGLVVIANGKVYEEIVPFKDGHVVYDEMLLSKTLDFKYNHESQFGAWIKTFKPKHTSSWLHGTAETLNYGDHYPMYWINHQFAQFGVSNWKSSAKDIYEITYDHNA